MTRKFATVAHHALEFASSTQDAKTSVQNANSHASSAHGHGTLPNATTATAATAPTPASHHACRWSVAHQPGRWTATHASSTPVAHWSNRTCVSYISGVWYRPRTRHTVGTASSPTVNHRTAANRPASSTSGATTR